MIRIDLLERAGQLRAGRVPFVVATVVRVERPASAKPGDCALVLPDGTIEGFVGGACSESTVRVQGLRQLAAGSSVLLRISPQGEPAPAGGDGVLTVPNPCLSGGTLDIFLEVMRPPMLVHVFGETPVARALESVGRGMGWDVQLTADATAAIPGDAGAVVVASQGGDEPLVLAAALTRGVPYVGLVASRKRGASVTESLDLDQEHLARLHTPAGLDIGAHAPSEIAVSILAEIIAAGITPTIATTVPATAIDPVCGMTVTISPSAIRLGENYFCSPACRERYTRPL
jgi:xanthine dehydrogenase accessory factor